MPRWTIFRLWWPVKLGRWTINVEFKLAKLGLEMGNRNLVQQRRKIHAHCRRPETPRRIDFHLNDLQSWHHGHEICARYWTSYRGNIREWLANTNRDTSYLFRSNNWQLARDQLTTGECARLHINGKRYCDDYSDNWCHRNRARWLWALFWVFWCCQLDSKHFKDWLNPR